VHDFAEDGGAGELLEGGAVADAGDVLFFLDLVDDEAGDGEAAVFDGAEGEEGVVEGAETVADDEKDGVTDALGEVGHAAVSGEGDVPAAGAFGEDEVMGVGRSDVAVSLSEGVDVGGEIFELAGDDGGSGGF